LKTFQEITCDGIAVFLVFMQVFEDSFFPRGAQRQTDFSVFRKTMMGFEEELVFQNFQNRDIKQRFFEHVTLL
jgi:hypothetical protein